MPELPEVETIVNDLLKAGIKERVITSARVRWRRTIAIPSSSLFVRRLLHQEVLNISRRGKYIVLTLNPPDVLLIHLRMSGRLLLLNAQAPIDPHDHVILTLDDTRSLHFRDPRKFGRMWLTDNPESILGKLGPEPLDPQFSARAFIQRLHQANRQIKPLLLDQSVLAGLGNIYTDEALWDAHIHPARKSSTLTDSECKQLYTSIRKALQKGIRNLGTSLGSGQTNFKRPTGIAGRNREGLQVYGQQNEPCPRCNTTIKRIVVGQRGTHICPSCQHPSTP